MDTRTCTALLAGAGLGCAATLFLMQRQQRWRLQQPEQQQPGTDGTQQQQGTVAGGPPVAMADVLGDDVLREQFTRNVQFFGEAAQQRLADSFVVVVGLGGVGSHAASMLLRSGVGRLRLVDFDQVSLSSLNRHAVAVRADVGTPKATCMAAHLRRMVPEAEVQPVVAMYTAQDEERLLAGAPDFVVDAIDNIDTKVALLAACARRGIPVVCSAGAGAKADPTRLRVADISEATNDPLARSVRYRLKKEHGVTSGIPVVLSTERPLCKLQPPDELTDGPTGSLADYQVMPTFRVRTIPVLGTSPAMFGMAAAAHVLCTLCGQPFLPEPMFTVREGSWAAQLQSLSERLDAPQPPQQQHCGGPPTPVSTEHPSPSSSERDLLVDEADVRFVVRDVWRGMSARAGFAGRPPRDSGLQRHIAGLALTRWDAARGAQVDNLVLLSHDEADAHDVADLARLRGEEPEFVRWVERRLAIVAAMFGLPADAHMT